MAKSDFVFPAPYNDGLTVQTPSGYHALNSLSNRRIVANLPVVWAPQAGYTGYLQGTTRVKAKFIRDTINWVLQFPGYSRPSSFVDPLEPDINQYEIIVTYQLLASDGVTVSGPVRELKSGGRKWFLVRPGTDTYTDPCGEFIPAGTEVYFYVWCNTRTSNATTINGETGQLAANSANFPRFDNIGGALGTNGVCGIYQSANTVIDVAFNQTATGVFTVNNTAGCSPSAIIGDVLNENGNASIIWVGDSISQGSNDFPMSTEAFSGQGVVGRTMAGQFACYNCGLNSTSAVSWASYYKVAHRTLNITNADTLVYWLGTNDFATGATFAQVQAAAINTWALARKAGIKRIVVLTCMYRYTSTDGYQTFVNQTNSGGANFVARATEWNDWLLTLPDEVDQVIDVVPLVQDRTQSGKYKLATTYVSGTLAAGSTTTVLNVADTLVASAHIGKSYFQTGDATLYRITANTTNTITIATALGGAPSAGVTYKILGVMSDDGTHPSQFGCQTLAAGINSALFNYR